MSWFCFEKQKLVIFNQHAHTFSDIIQQRDPKSKSGIS